MTRRLRVGTRASPLARAQTDLVIRALRRSWPGFEAEPIAISTQGDLETGPARTLDFTDRIDGALEAGRIDFAVHSAKDLPSRFTRAVTIAAFPPRADARDCAVLAEGGPFGALRSGARIGSSSVRRKAQILRWRPDLAVVPVRGNVGTRIDGIRTHRLDGVVLAAAGLQRLGWSNRISERLPISRMLPAPGQGALAVVVRSTDAALARRLRQIEDPRTRAAVTAERAVQAALGGDCDLPMGAHATSRSGVLKIRAAWLSDDGRIRVYREAVGRPEEAELLGGQVGALLARARGEAHGPEGRP